MDTIRKVLDDCEVKKVGEREYEFTASTSTQDRDGEVIESKGWDLKNYRKNPVIMYAHDYRSLPVGKATKVWLTNGKLKNTIQFPPEGTYEFADTVERLVATGYLRTESVGFIPKKWTDGEDEKAPRRTYTKQELLEISIVPVPSNPDALRNAMDDGVITTKEFEAITKPKETEDTSMESNNDTVTTIPEKKSLSQEELKDELDYIKESIEEVGLNEESKEIVWNIVREIMRLHGDDIPFDIEEKVRVSLSQKNEDGLNQIVETALDILDSTEDTFKPKEEPQEAMTEQDIISLVTNTVSAVIAKAQGKI